MDADLFNKAMDDVKVELTAIHNKLVSADTSYQMSRISETGITSLLVSVLSLLEAYTPLVNTLETKLEENLQLITICEGLVQDNEMLTKMLQDRMTDV